jgi:tetratricopeptide (TPR) repeat protein
LLKSPEKKSRKKHPAKREKKPAPRWFFAVLFLIPIIFFVLLEICLRIFNYGYDTTQWIPATDDKYYLNPEIARRYFYNTERVPYSNQDFFDMEKKQNAFRVFILGGSSAAGYPFSPLGSFSRYLRKRLEILYPSSEIEVVNIGLTAVNSYTIRDLMPGVLEQKPDLILIYAGHNEYYGALGAGSMESLGNSRELVNLILYLNKYKTVELLRNIIKGIVKIFSSESEYKSGTLMSRMAKDQYISFNSETYFNGISQFDGNMRDILEMAKEKNVPVILSTLASNLKDQPPFVSVKSDKLPEANVIYTEAKNELNSENYKKADSLFRFAKDLDALRFRAPEEINRIIKSLGEKYNFPVVNIDSVFSAVSPDGITGKNLMTDHLHPTLKGYHLIGKVFFDKMKEKNFLPSSEPLNLPDKEQDSITVSSFNFTKLDSVLAEFRIKILKNDWPFVEKATRQQPYSVLLKPKNIIDSIAVEVINDEIIWEAGHRKLAAYYLEKNDIISFLKEMDALIFQYPVVIEYYEYVVNVLIPLQEYDKAYKYLETGYKIKPTAYTAKWLGTINLYNKNFDVAEKYLKESLNFDNNDAQVWYNLAGVYVMKKDYKLALETVNKALSISPDYPEAISLRQQLQNAVK